MINSINWAWFGQALLSIKGCTASKTYRSKIQGTACRALTGLCRGAKSTRASIILNWKEFRATTNEQSGSRALARGDQEPNGHSLSFRDPVRWQKLLKGLPSLQQLGPSMLYGRGARRKPPLSERLMKAWSLQKAPWELWLWERSHLMKPELNCLASVIGIMSAGNQAPLITSAIPSQQNTKQVVQHHAGGVGFFFLCFFFFFW